MGMTMKVARDRQYDEAVTVFPNEVARGFYVENPPSAAGLKLLHMMIAKAGPAMAEDRQHSFRLAEIKAIAGMQNHTRTTLRELFVELSATVIVFDDTAAKVELIGSFMDGARLDYRDESSGDLLVSWRFGSTFREVVARSEFWALLDRQAVFSFSSRYSIMLYQHIASFVGLTRVRKKTFTVDGLRSALGVPPTHHRRFAELNRHALAPAITEISSTTRHRLTAKLIKTGRTVTAVEIGWTDAY